RLHRDERVVSESQDRDCRRLQDGGLEARRVEGRRVLQHAAPPGLLRRVLRRSDEAALVGAHALPARARRCAAAPAAASCQEGGAKPCTTAEGKGAPATKPHLCCPRPIALLRHLSAPTTVLNVPTLREESGVKEFYPHPPYELVAAPSQSE